MAAFASERLDFAAAAKGRFPPLAVDPFVQRLIFSRLQRTAEKSASVNSTFDPRCTLHQWLVFPLRGSTEFFADAAFPSLRAHAAEKPNSHNGLFRRLRCAMTERPVFLIGSKVITYAPEKITQQIKGREWCIIPVRVSRRSDTDLTCKLDTPELQHKLNPSTARFER